jgi:dolichol kinase
MSAALAVDSRDLALELHDLLRDLDPVRWRADLDLERRLKGIQERLAGLLSTQVDDALAALNAQLAKLALLLEEIAPDTDKAGADLRKEWQLFRLKVQPQYEALAASLGELDIHVPSLRPTNSFRSVFHLLSGLFVVALIELILPSSWLTPIAGTFAGMAWVFEISRRYSPAWNKALMWAFSAVAHPHEQHRVNSSTWYVTALLLLSLTGELTLCAVAAAVLAVADPSAAAVGRRYGSIKLVNGRSLQGTLTFAVTGTLAAWAVLELFEPVLTGWRAPVLALFAAVPAAIAELYSRRVDDNFSIPMTAAAGLWVGLLLLG